ncbi:17394_t:CDS:2 [Acaulospora morrowiae]|uniref:17394_t:CDS:1 n=1 Tax=Acaulospora morrowiae TaxID=94023 RepID=A0A9N9A9Z0_9GLOM|nr:17394_t:CDS:2 [Acaulospora morrowiae]
MSSQHTLRSSLRDTTSEYNDNLVARNNRKIVKKTTTVKKTTPFKRSTPISNIKADVTQKMNIPNHRHLKSISVLETDMTNVSMIENLSDTKDIEKPTEEPNIAVIFINYTDAEEACTDPISEFENSKSRLALTLNTYETNYKSVRIRDILQHLSKRDITTGATKFDPIDDIMQQVGAKACYIPQTNETRKRFTSLNFTSQEDLTKATASDIDFKGYKLT